MKWPYIFPLLALSLGACESILDLSPVSNLTNATYAWWSDVRGLSVPRPLPAGAADVPPVAFTQPGRNASASLTFRF